MDAFIISSWQFSEGVAHEHTTSPASFEQSTWYHCQRDADGLREWLHSNTVPNAIIDSLLTDDTRPRFEQFGHDCFLMILRGINLNEGANPDDMLSLRILWYKGTLISTRKVPSKAVSNLISDLKQNQGPTSLPDVLLGMIRGINHSISTFLVPVELLIDELESTSNIDIRSINALHSRLLRLRRYLKPQKYVFEDLMSDLPTPLSKHNSHIKNSLDTILRINESVEFYIEQINVFLASLSQQQAEKMNRNTYLFSIIAGIFLPAGFFTGLLGVNIAGIPGTDNPIAFPLFCVGLLVVIAAEVIILKKIEVYLMVEFLQSNMWLKQVGLGLLLITVYWVIKRLGKNWIETLAENKRVELKRKQFVIKCFNIVLFLLFIAVFTIVLNLGFGDISLFLSSIFAVLGVALFAQWSILSNLTASVLIFFVFPYRIGDRVRVAEKDEDISGVIIDITMFHVILRHSSGNIITYPNNLILQKGVIKVLVDPELKSETVDTKLIKAEDSGK